MLLVLMLMLLLRLVVMLKLLFAAQAAVHDRFSAEVNQRWFGDIVNAFCCCFPGLDGVGALCIFLFGTAKLEDDACVFLF